VKKNDFIVMVGTAAVGLLIPAAAVLLSSFPLGQAQDQVLSLRGAGSTFAAPLYRKWIEEYAVAHRGVMISYDAVGSGEGVKRFLDRSVDFAGSDEVLSSSEMAKIPGALMLPITAGMITIAYNIPGVNSEIKLPRDVYVDIFVRKIRKWDDPRIAAANPGITFPHRDIALVVRQDSSGTTAAFTNHLATIGSSWRTAGMDVGKFVEWPGAVLSAPGNEGVAARIRLSEGSIGYVEYWFAQRLGLRMAALANKAGNFITPTAHAGELALSGRVAQVQELAASVADPSGADAYPLVSYSWMLVYAQYADQAKASVLREFAGWSMSDRGQDYGAQLGYLPLSSDVLGIGRQALANRI
jgi:phosphate transport system substrate-binding protein